MIIEVDKHYIDTLHDKIRDLSKINHKLEQENKELKEKLEYIQGITGILARNYEDNFDTKSFT